jgi:hypothetical protein
MFDDHEIQDSSPNKEATARLIDIGSTVPLVMTLASYDNPFLKVSQDVDMLINMIVHEMAENCHTAIMCVSRWMENGMDTYDAADRDEVPWPDVNMESAREEAPELNHVFDYVLNLFEAVRVMEKRAFVTAMHDAWHSFDEDERTALLFTVLMAVANTMHTAVQVAGHSQIHSILEAKVKLRDVENPEDLLK